MYQNPYMMNTQYNGNIANPYIGQLQNPNSYYTNMYNTQPQNQYASTLSEVISGAIVDSEDVVKSKNCSLDGSATYYPLSDKSAIYVKQLNPQTGAGMMLKYKLEAETNEDNKQDNQYIILLSNFKEEISKEINELKNLVVSQETATTSSIRKTTTGGGK